MRLVVISLLLALCIAQDQLTSEEYTAWADFRKSFIINSSCLEQENLTMDEVMDYAIDGKLEESESTPELKCFTACLLEYTNILNNCMINEELFASAEALINLQDLLTTCKPAIDADERCECAYQLAKCMADSADQKE